jgi:hypothetical protein
VSVEESTPTETKIDVGQIAGVIGALSVVGLFLAASMSYAFGRGLATSIGFPAEIMTLRTSVDTFSGIALQYTTVFVVMLMMGFVLFRASRAKSSKLTLFQWILIGIVLLLSGIGTLWDEHSNFFNGCLIIAHLTSPLLPGYFFNVFDNHRIQKWATTIFALLISLGLAQEALYSYGYSKGKEISRHTTPVEPGSERGFSTVKMSDFPIIDLVTKDSLRLSVTSKPFDGGTWFSSVDKCFLRLIAYDDANYFVIEECNGTTQPAAIRKEAVREVLFLRIQ